MLLRIEENKLYRVFISSDANKEFLLSTNNYIEIEDSLVPDSYFLKYDSDKNVIIDEEAELEFNSEETKKNVKNFLTKTDFLLLIDNPKKLSEDEINSLIVFRDELRNSTIKLPVIPEFLQKLNIF